MRLQIVYFIFFVLIFSDFSNAVNSRNTKTETFAKHISEFRLPKTLSFCGEAVDLTNPIFRERAEREFYINLQNSGQIILYLKRSARYFPIFDTIFKKYNIPDDFKYMAVAESGLLMVKSPKDAHGIWQFIPSTAKSYDLEVNEFIDERLNVAKSTEAACRYILSAYKTFGSWSMAAAAYNMGFSNLKSNVEFQNVDNYFDLYLNEETYRFVFRILILKELLSNHKQYGFNLKPEDFYFPPKTKQIVWNDKIDNLAEWAKSMGTTYHWVKILNPWILKRSLPKPKDYYIIDIPKND